MPCWTILVFSSQCNVGLMSLAGHGPKSGARHVCLIIALTGQQGPVLYKENKGVNDAARQTEGGPHLARAIRPHVYIC